MLLAIPQKGNYAKSAASIIDTWYKPGGHKTTILQQQLAVTLQCSKRLPGRRCNVMPSMRTGNARQHTDASNRDTFEERSMRLSKKQNTQKYIPGIREKKGRN